MPLFACETLAGQMFCWILVYTPILVQNLIHFSIEFEPSVIVTYWLICFAVYFFLVADLPIGIKTTVK